MEEMDRMTSAGRKFDTGKKPGVKRASMKEGSSHGEKTLKVVQLSRAQMPAELPTSLEELQALFSTMKALADST
ncbi:hypothetical protein DXG03_003536, partial [Asterophora parasitica]